MTLVWVQAVRFNSFALDPREDRLIKWLIDLNFWNTTVKYQVMAARGYLPLEVEYELKEKLGLPLDHVTKTLFSRLIGSDMGLSLKSLGFCDQDWDDPETCCGKLLQLNLARVQDSERFKAISYAFDTRIQYLVGVRQNPN